MNRTHISPASAVVPLTVEPEPLLAAVGYRKEYTKGSGCLSFSLLIAGGLGTFMGIFLFFPLLVVGIPLVGLAFATSARKIRVPYCGECGNDIGPVSRICPVCKATFVDR